MEKAYTWSKKQGRTLVTFIRLMGSQYIGLAPQDATIYNE
jgi:hypothetical protein